MVILFRRYIIDGLYSGLALEENGECCFHLLTDPKVKIRMISNSGIGYQ